MIGNKKIRLISFLLLIIWMIVIFMMSAQSANKSSQVSGGIVSKLIDILYSHFDDISTEMQVRITHNLTFIIRKTAHFLEYFVLGVLSAILAFTYEKSKFIAKFFGAIIFCMIYSISDEVHQYFVPGRACRLYDVFIDSMGGICAVVLIAFILKTVRAKKSGGLNAKKEID